MNFDQIIELIKVVSASELTAFQYEEGNQKITMQAGGAIVNTVTTENIAVQETVAAVPRKPQTAEVQSMPAAEVAQVAAPVGEVVTSPLVGRFYVAPSEDAEPYVKVGDTVKKGQVLAIVEAMKLMNEIESDFDGVVTEVLAENGEGVEYGQPLFRIQA